jgi:hypothetical protein
MVIVMEENAGAMEQLLLLQLLLFLITIVVVVVASIHIFLFAHACYLAYIFRVARRGWSTSRGSICFTKRKRTEEEEEAQAQACAGPETNVALDGDDDAQVRRLPRGFSLFLLQYLLLKPRRLEIIARNCDLAAVADIFTKTCNLSQFQWRFCKGFQILCSQDCLLRSCAPSSSVFVEMLRRISALVE